VVDSKGVLLTSGQHQQKIPNFEEEVHYLSGTQAHRLPERPHWKLSPISSTDSTSPCQVFFPSVSFHPASLSYNQSVQ
jgi:hypothetical protein